MSILQSEEVRADQLMQGRPNILLFGVGHSGTSIVAKMIRTLGWNLGGADGFGENVAVRAVNIRILGKHPVDASETVRVLEQLPSPWLLKDPRFVLTLERWIPIFQG